MNDGKVWKKSQINKITLVAVEFCAHKDPTVTPMTVAAMTAKDVM